MEFSRQEYWSGLPFPTPVNLPSPSIEATSALADGFFITESYLSSSLGTLQPRSCSWSILITNKLSNTSPSPLCMLQSGSLPTGPGRACHLHAMERETESGGGAVTASPSIGPFCGPPCAGRWAGAEELCPGYWGCPRKSTPHLLTPFPQMAEERLRLFLSLSCPQPLAELPPPYNLQEVQVSIINKSRCSYLFQQPYYRSNINYDMICAGSEDGDADSCKVSTPPQ